MTNLEPTWRLLDSSYLWLDDESEIGRHTFTFRTMKGTTQSDTVRVRLSNCEAQPYAVAEVLRPGGWVQLAEVYASPTSWVEEFRASHGEDSMPEQGFDLLDRAIRVLYG